MVDLRELGRIFDELHNNPVTYAREAILDAVLAAQSAKAPHFVTTLVTKPEETAQIIAALTEEDAVMDDHNGLIKYTAKINFWIDKNTPSYVYVKNGRIAQISTNKLF